MAFVADLSSADVAALTGGSYRQVDCLVRDGVIAPGVADVSGSGRVRRWSRHDAYLVRACIQLARLGAGRGVQAALVAAVRADPSLADGPVAIDPYLQVSRAGEEVGEAAYRLDLDACRRAVDFGLSRRLFASPN